MEGNLVMRSGVLARTATPQAVAAEKTALKMQLRQVAVYYGTFPAVVDVSMVIPQNRIVAPMTFWLSALTRKVTENCRLRSPLTSADSLVFRTVLL